MSSQRERKLIEDRNNARLARLELLAWKKWQRDSRKNFEEGKMDVVLRDGTVKKAVRL